MYSSVQIKLILAAFLMNFVSGTSYVGKRGLKGLKGDIGDQSVVDYRLIDGRASEQLGEIHQRIDNKISTLNQKFQSGISNVYSASEKMFKESNQLETKIESLKLQWEGQISKSYSKLNAMQSDITKAKSIKGKIQSLSNIVSSISNQIYNIKDTVDDYF